MILTAIKITLCIFIGIMVVGIILDFYTKIIVGAFYVKRLEFMKKIMEASVELQNSQEKHPLE